MDDHACLARAEADFREAVQREQSALMASGVCRAEATEILLRRLRGNSGKPFRAGPSAADATPSTRARPSSPPDFPPAEFATLVNVHGYSAEDAARALTICHEIRLLEAAGVGGVAAAEELTRRVLYVDKGSGIEGRGTQTPSTQDSTRSDDVGVTGAATSRMNGGGAAIGFSSGGRRHSRSSCTTHRPMRGEDSSSSAFLAPPPMPWEPPLQGRGSRGSRGAHDGAGGITGGDHISGCTTRGGVTGADPKGSISTVAPASGGGRSPRLGSRKRQHASMLVQHNCGDVVEQGSFSHTLPPRAASGVNSGGGVNCGVSEVFPWSPSPAGPATPYASRLGAGGCSNGGFVTAVAGAGSTATTAVSTSTSLSVHRPPGDGMNGMKGCDGMDISNAQVQAPAAKRPRCHGPGGGQEGDGLSSERGDPRQLVFVDQGHRQEDQEHQLHHAFHQLGVRQRNTQPSSPPLMSAVPPKRPRTPNDETPPAPYKRLRNS